MNMRPAPVFLAVAAAVTAFAAPAAFAVGDDALRECVARNAVRYSDPGSAAVAQYIEVESACRSALESDDSSGFTIAGGPSEPAPGPRSDESGPDTAPGGGADGSAADGGTSGGGGGGAVDDFSGGEGAPAQGDDAIPVDEETAIVAPAGPGVAEEADVAVAEPLPVEAAGATPFSGAPGWLALLVGSAFVASAAVAGWEARQRRQG